MRYGMKTFKPFGRRLSAIITILSAIITCCAGCTTFDNGSTVPGKPSAELPVNPAASADRSDDTDIAADIPGDTADNIPDDTADDVPGSTAAPEEFIPDPIDEYISLMTLEEKVCHLFIIQPEALSAEISSSVTVDETTLRGLQNRPVGGFIYFKNNLVNPDQTHAMLDATTQYGCEVSRKTLSDGTVVEVAPFLAVDEEGGSLVARIANNPAFKVSSVPDMCKITDPDEAFRVGAFIGTYLADLGFNLDFAPVADTITNPLNTVIGKRSFGTDPERVRLLAASVSDGLHDHGIISCYKHFPGHGSTEGDTHLGLAYTDDTLDELLEDDLIPFADASRAGVDMVMAAHISVPGVLGDNTPCSLSERMLTDILRGTCGFEGLVITDALNMGAIVNTYGADEAAVAAFAAGADILLMPAELSTAVDAVIAAVSDGTVSEERLNESVRRILKVKEQYRILNISTP